MKLGKFLEEQDFGKYLQVQAKADASQNQARGIFERGTAFIKKFKYEPNTNWYLLFPLEMTLPFNPTDLTDETYSDANPFVLPGSVSIAIKFLKGMMKDDDALHQKVLDVLRTDDEALHMEANECVDMTEGRIWHKLCRVQYYVGWSQKLNDGTNSFPVSIGCDVQLDDTGTVVGSKGVGYTLYQLENALISIKVQATTEKYEQEGRSDTDLSDTIKALWQNRIIKNPTPVAFSHIFFIKGKNDEGNVSTDFINSWEQSQRLSEHEGYIRYTTKFNDAIAAKIGSKKFDNNLDFIETALKIPKEDAADKAKIYRDAVLVTCAKSVSIFDEDNGNGECVKDFAEHVAEYISDTTAWNTESFKRSIRELQKRSDSDLLASMKNAIKIYEDALKNEKILADYGSVLESIDANITASIAESILDGEVNNYDVNQDIINALPTEKGFGEEGEGEATDDFSSLTDEFQAALDDNGSF
jgi:hypothetical protein